MNPILDHRWAELQAGAIPTETEQEYLDQLNKIAQKGFEESEAVKAIKEARRERTREYIRASKKDRNKRRNLRRKLRRK